MKQIKIKSYAKLNLALNIVGKTSNLHKIESIVAFVSLHDEIFINKIKSKSHNISFFGKFSRNISNNNTVSKLLKILEKKELLKDTKFKHIYEQALKPESFNYPVTHICSNCFN